MRKAWIGAFFILWTIQVAYAGNLSLVSRGVTSIPGESTAYQILLGVNNTGAPYDLLGWQLKCEIHPIAGASGLQFDFNDDTFMEGAFSQPPNYVFDEYGALAGGDCSYETFIATDIIFFGDPVSVPTEGANLLQINLRASPGASGQFDIVVMAGDETSSGWFYEPSFLDLQQFDLPPSGVIESLFIPEPSAIMLLMAAISVALVTLVWRRFG